MHVAAAPRSRRRLHRASPARSVSLMRPRPRSSTQLLSTPGCAELVRVRASQLNGCAYCIDMHTKDALTEAVTLLAADHVPSEAFKAAASEFTARELGALISLIVTINAWNAIGVTTRAW